LIIDLLFPFTDTYIYHSTSNTDCFVAPSALAQDFWIRFAQELFIEAAKEGIRSYGRRELPVNQSEAFDSVISRYIAGRRVDFSNNNDGRQFSGTVTSSWVQRNGNTSQSGAAGAISWKDGVNSTVLFLENQRVRIWSSKKEYGGQWIAKDGVLYVRTDVADSKLVCVW
jgi:hypothetical protein